MSLIILYIWIHSFVPINEARYKERIVNVLSKEIFEYNSFFIHDTHCQNSQWLLSVLVICMFRFYYQNIVLLIVQNGQYTVHPNLTCRLVHFLFCGGRYDFFLANCCDWFIDVNVSQTHAVIFFSFFLLNLYPSPPAKVKWPALLNYCERSHNISKLSTRKNNKLSVKKKAFPLSTIFTVQYPIARAKYAKCIYIFPMVSGKKDDNSLSFPFDIRTSSCFSRVKIWIHEFNYNTLHTI